MPSSRARHHPHFDDVSVCLITVYKCGAVEHVETKAEDCKRKDCIDSKKHPRNCTQESFLMLLRRLLLNQGQQDHGLACRVYRETGYTFLNRPTEQCSDKNCKLMQNQSDPGFQAAVGSLRAYVQEKVREQERVEQDAASTKQLRDEPM